MTATLDYLPFVPGLRLEYEVERAQEMRTLLVEHLAAEGRGVIVRRTWTAPDGKSETETSRGERRPDGAYADGVLVLPAPPRVGAKWSQPPREFSVLRLDAPASVPAGDFPDCLQVGYLIAGGDGGSGERLYAPGVGLVHELCADEADPYEVRLINFSVKAGTK